MNEYGKRVTKKMEDYMDNPDSVDKEVSDIQNAIEGVEVRGALAAGVKKSFDKSKDAEGKADEAHDVMESIINDGFDNAALEANFEQKLDDKIADLQPEWTQFKDDTVSQLADETQQVENKNVTDGASYIEPFHIETFDGSNEPYHPSVVYFPNREGWNGYRFWMVQTPFPLSNKPPYRDRWECPSILRSPDGQDWRKPFNAPNPLVDLTEEEISRGDYYSDSCILMNGQTMEIFYRKTNGSNRTQTDIYRITTNDGETFTDPEIVFEPLNSNNGFPGTSGMRAQQLFLNGSRYEAFFSLQGGASGEMAYAETPNPSTGVWENFTKIDFVEAPDNMSIWHAGMYREGNVYHMIGYDINNRALHYFTSTNKKDFYYKGTPIKADSVLTNLRDLYHSAPVKIDDVWAVYVGGTYRNSFNSSKNGISLFYGKTLDNLTPITPRQKYLNYFPTLVNDFEQGNVSRNYYATYTDFNRDRFNGYGMKFGEGDNEVNVPTWKQNTKNHPIIHMYDYNGRPVHTPEHIGMVYRDTSRNNELYISIGVESPDDWKRISLSKTMTKVEFSEILNADLGDIIAIESGEGTISRMTGGTEGCEVLILNVTGANTIHVQNGGSVGEFRIGNDVTLKVYDLLTVIKIGGRWYKK